GVQACADANDELVNGEKRRLIGLTLQKFASFTSTVELLRTYAGCWVIPEDDGFRLVPDRPASSVKTFSEATNIIENSLRIRSKSITDRPNYVEVEYRDSTAFNWRTFSQVSEEEGVSERRESVVSLPGIHRASQAKREAEERRLWA